MDRGFVLPAFRTARVLVAGDVMLDRYWIGDSTRISPEAPVPVIHVRSCRETPGGAANVALNVANLGAACTLIAAVGDDPDGRALETLLRDRAVDCRLLKPAALRTTVKLRLLARGQQLVRADFEEPCDERLLAPLAEMLGERVAQADCIVLSDYAKGALAHIGTMMASARAARRPVLVDPKGSDYRRYRGATVVTPNESEFEAVVGHWADEAGFERHGFALRTAMDFEHLLVTRAEKGMSLFTATRHIRIPAQAREVFDVSGAGDTVIATIACALAAGADIETAARLANAAAGVVVGKVGTTPVTFEELRLHV